jgi:Mce-associated membrane protein
MAKHADATRKIAEVNDPDTSNDFAVQVNTEAHRRPVVATTGADDCSMTERTDAEAETGADPDDGGGDGEPGADPVRAKALTRLTPIRIGAISGIATVVALTALAGWLGHRAYESHRTQQQRELFLEVGRQGAVNLTTIDWEHADADAQRVLNASTGTFYDDFSARSRTFVDVVKQAKSKSVGTVTEAGVESESTDQAQILVAVAVQESNAGAPQQEPRGWRMRVTVQKVGNEVKVANVGFVP